MNYTPLKLPLKTSSSGSAGLVPAITFGVLALSGIAIVGAIFFTNTSNYKATRAEEIQNYTIAHSTNVAATVAASALLGPNHKAPTDIPLPTARPVLADLVPEASVAGVATSAATVQEYVPNRNVSYATCIGPAGTGTPNKDIKALSERCPLYLPKNESSQDLSYTELPGSLTVKVNNTVLYEISDTPPKANPAPECLTIDRNMFGGNAGKSDIAKVCTMTKIAPNPDQLLIDDQPARSVLVQKLNCEDETEASCSVDSANVMVEVDGGILLSLPHTAGANGGIDLAKVN